MLFKRKEKLNLTTKIKNLVLPEMGWKRCVTYYRLRIKRLKASTHSIAGGLAIGCSISCTPVLGFHIIQALLLSKLFRWNYISSVVGTAFGNPWSFPFLLSAEYFIGKKIMGFIGYDTVSAESVSIEMTDNFFDKSFDILVPMLFGGYFLAIISFPIFYIIFYSLVKKSRLEK